MKYRPNVFQEGKWYGAMIAPDLPNGGSTIAVRVTGKPVSVHYVPAETQNGIVGLAYWYDDGSAWRVAFAPGWVGVLDGFDVRLVPVPIAG